MLFLWKISDFMSRKYTYLPDEDNNETVKRYEDYLSGTSTGYFDVDELETIVDFYLLKGRTKDCSQAIDLGLKLHPRNYTLLTKRAKVYLTAGDAKKAIRILDSLSHHEDSEVKMLRMESLILLNRDKEARILADELINNESEDADILCLDIAYTYIGQLRFESALEFLIQGNKFNPSNTDLLFELAFVYEQLDNTEEAVNTYNKILDINAFSSEAWFNIGQIYYNDQEYKKALYAYDYVLTLDENDIFAMQQKGHSLFQLGDYSKALDSYNDYDKKVIFDSQIKIFIAECYEKMEDFQTAFTFYEKAIKLDPESYDGLIGAGVCLLELEQYTESIQYIQKALKINENAADAWVYLAEGLIGINETDNALLAYLKSLTIDQDQPDTIMSVANICMEKSEFGIALEYYQEAYSLNNELEYIHLFMAVAYFKMDNRSESLKSFKIAISKDEDAWNLFYDLCPEAAKYKSFRNLLWNKQYKVK